MKKEKVLVQCVVNGEEVAEYVDPRESLLICSVIISALLQ